ncbi:MAG: DUF1080 domain-containing protein [Planctomycetes bacterium]|nr:DUF1080 domain-containing protein [Planctomycetota bacterium]
MRDSRMIFALVTLFACLAAPALAADDGGFKAIFDSQDLKGWDGNPDFWRVEDGAITGQTTDEKPTRGNTFIIWRDGASVDDFELKLEYRIVGGNSGIQYRSFEVPGEKWVVGGYQADIDSGDRFSGILYGERDRGVLAERGQKTTIGDDHKPRVTGSVGDSAEIQSKIAKEGWNAYHVIARGNKLVHKLNGVTTVEVTDDDAKGRRRSGILAFQLHAGPPMKVQFKDVRLKRLPVEGARKVVFVAGHRSHGFGSHDHSAGCKLLARQLEASGLGLVTSVYYPDWPSDPTALDNANAVVVYSDGGGGHPIANHVDEVAPLAKKGLGVGFIHYAVEVEKGKVGDAFLEWTGGYFERKRSVNPHWTPEKSVTVAKDHPIARGVRPYSVNDEWYFFMRFRPNMEGVTPIFSAVAGPDTMTRPDGDHSGNPDVRASVARGDLQHLLWARERPDGGRGFGFTGGHVHWNWGHPDHRKLVTNAIAWIAGVEVPAGGVSGGPVTVEDLLRDHDEERPRDFKPEAVQRQLEAWSKASAGS